MPPNAARQRRTHRAFAAALLRHRSYHLLACVPTVARDGAIRDFDARVPDRTELASPLCSAGAANARNAAGAADVAVIVGPCEPSPCAPDARQAHEHFVSLAADLICTAAVR